MLTEISIPRIYPAISIMHACIMSNDIVGSDFIIKEYGSCNDIIIIILVKRMKYYYIQAVRHPPPTPTPMRCPTVPGYTT